MKMLDNNIRFKLPSFNIIGGSTKTFKVNLKNLFGNSSVFFCDQLSPDNLSIITSDGTIVVPDENCLYIINDAGADYQYYMWDGSSYVSPSFILSVSNFAGFATNLVLEKECIVNGSEVYVALDFADTININGKFIYQIAAYLNSDSGINYIAEQGFLIVSKNIDFESNILNGINESTYEDDDLLFVYEEMDAYIVGSVPFASNWLSLSANGDPLAPNDNVIYIISDGDYAGKYVWDASTVTYIEYED